MRYLNSPLFPNSVEFSTYKDSVFAYFRFEDSDAKTIGEVTTKLAELGFGFSGFSYDLGYYDSIDNKTLEYHHPTGGKKLVETLKLPGKYTKS